MCKHWEEYHRAFGKRCLKCLPYILISIHCCLFQTDTSHTHANILFQCKSVWIQRAPSSPTPQRLPITKEVINSTTAPSREIDFNDTNYTAAVSVTDSHLHTSRDPVGQFSAALHCKATQKKQHPSCKRHFIVEQAAFGSPNDNSASTVSVCILTAGLILSL